MFDAGASDGIVGGEPALVNPLPPRAAFSLSRTAAMCQELSALQQSICDYATSFDIESLIPSQADEVVRNCSKIEASISAIKSLAVAKSAEGMAWKQQGFRSAADKLAQETGMSPGAAKRTVQTGQRMTEQPEVAKAALSGEISPEQADAVSDGAAANPDKAEELVKKAKNSLCPNLTRKSLESRRPPPIWKHAGRRFTPKGRSADGQTATVLTMPTCMATQRPASASPGSSIPYDDAWSC